MISFSPRISATVITKNEEGNIADCLETLSWADEIVVLDSESTDRTVEIAKKYTDKVFVETWKGQGHHKNRATELAQGPWIFSIDADERVTPELAEEIRQVISDPGAEVYAMKRKNIYRNQWIRHCGWYPDRVKRIFKKGETYFNERVIHESLETKSRVGKLSNPLLHYSFRSAEDFLERARRYAYHQAREMHREGKKASVWTALSHAGFALFKAYFLRLGFMDGAAGVLVSVYEFIGVFYRYMILRELSR